MTPARRARRRTNEAIRSAALGAIAEHVSTAEFVQLALDEQGLPAVLRERLEVRLTLAVAQELAGLAARGRVRLVEEPSTTRARARDAPAVASPARPDRG
jgi:hypothetical protein